ncbi:hypothetical protein D3C86_1411130 [compost metagenome]
MNIKFFILLFLLATSACKITAQCNFTSKSFNGSQIKIGNPLLVAFDRNYQIALSITQVADTKFLILTARFAEKRKNNWFKFNGIYNC